MALTSESISFIIILLPEIFISTYCIVKLDYVETTQHPLPSEDALGYFLPTAVDCLSPPPKTHTLKS